MDVNDPLTQQQKVVNDDLKFLHTLHVIWTAFWRTTRWLIGPLRFIVSTIITILLTLLLTPAAQTWLRQRGWLH